MGLAHGTNIVKDGLVFWVDPTSKRCFFPQASSTTSIESLAPNLPLSGSATSTGIYDSANHGIFDFDGISARFAFESMNTSSFFDYDEEYNFSIWIKQDDWGDTNGNQKHFGSGGYYSGGSSRGMEFAQFNSPSTLSVMIRTNATYYYLSAVDNAGFVNNSGNFDWAYFSCNKINTGGSNSKLELYVNGVFNGERTGILDGAISGLNNNVLGLGGNPGNSTYASRAKIGPVKIYNRTLSQKEIYQNFLQYKWRYQ
jgi:hypothetical protein